MGEAVRGSVLAMALAGAAWFFLSRIGGANNSAADVALIEAQLAANMVMGGGVLNMKLSDAGLRAIAEREGFSAMPYKDATGYSIGYGHFIQVGELFSEPMNRETAAALLLADSEIAQKAVRAYVNVPLTQAQYDALVSLVYNIGSGAFRNSTLLKNLNAGDYLGAAGGMLAWNRSGGVVLAALDARRAGEYQQFLG